jgi:two-component system, response regulator
VTAIKANQVILIVDDSDDDYDATVRALRSGGNLTNPIHRCENGKQALDYLFRRIPHEQPSPGLILLDLNMPGVDGRRVLAEVKGNEGLRRIPIIVMTNSEAERDVEACYQLGANTYVRKPFDFPNLCKTIQCIKEYWFEIASLSKA